MKAMCDAAQVRTTETPKLADNSGPLYSQHEKHISAAVTALLRRQTLLVCIALLPMFASAQNSLIAGANINMVSGTEFPGGDPFLQRQNEPSLAVSTRNTLHLLGGANDYRTVDIPGLTDGKTVGDSWPGVFSSLNGGGSWLSTLLPGYPQDQTANGLNSPLKGYQAGADPVIRAGTNGLFYYSGIVFDRGPNAKSAAFVSRFMDLNNDPRIPRAFEDGAIRYIDTQVVDSNDPGADGNDNTDFIDKPWIAVDIPRWGAQKVTLNVPQGSTSVPQSIDCGNVYSTYARISGEDTADLDAHIMFSKSTDCGASFSIPIELDGNDRTINQGASIAINPGNGHIYVSWRQFQKPSLNCTLDSWFWEANPDAWPVERFMVGGVLYNKEQALAIMAGWQNGNPWRLARELIVAKLNILAGAADAEVVNTIEEADALLLSIGWVYDGSVNTKKTNDNNKDKTNSSPAIEFADFLEDFNSGIFGPASCGDQLPTRANPDAIMVVHSTDSGETFSEPVLVSELIPFDQGTTRFTFRSNSYPTMTVDDSGRVYIAWSTRGRPDEPEFVDSRIVASTSTDGVNWTLSPNPVDEDPSLPRGHQIQPSITFNNGKLILIYLDFRQDHSAVFERFIADVPTDPPAFRHTVDVRAAQADPSNAPVFADYNSSVLNPGSTQLSRYFNLMLQWEPGAPASREQLQYNPLNQPLFKGGTVPFIGDYIDVAPSPAFVSDVDSTGKTVWHYNSGNGDSPVFHAAWSDNRDVRGPFDGDWTKYVAPSADVGSQSLFDGSTIEQSCEMADNVDRIGLRNQNIYTSRITHGLYVAIPNNSRPLSTDFQRSFVVYAKYSNYITEADPSTEKVFTLSIANQPEGMVASFDQFDPNVTEVSVTLGNNSSMARTVFVTSTDPSASVEVIVTDPLGSLQGSARINSDPTNPAPLFDAEIFSSDIVDSDKFFKSNVFNESSVFDVTPDGTLILKHNPDNPFLFEDGKIDSTLNTSQLEFLSQALIQLSLSNPDVFNPGIYNPGIYNPGIYNPGIYNPGIYNPGIYNPGIYNPGIYNPGIYNPGIYNPGIYNPGIYNGTITDVNYTVTNDGVTNSAYNVNLRLDDTSADYIYQLIVSRLYKTPVADGCNIIEAPVQEVLVSNINPNLSGNLLSSNSDDTFYLDPGDTAIVTLRVIPIVTAPTPLALNELSISIVADAVSETALAGETQPDSSVVLSDSLKGNPLTISPASLVDATGGLTYTAQLKATGGAGLRTWSLAPGSARLPNGLSLSASGEINGIPLVGGTFQFFARVVDETQITEASFTLTSIAPADLVITSLAHSPAQPAYNEIVTFRAEVSNLGGVTAPASSFEFRVSGDSGQDIFLVPMLELAGGESVLVEFTTEQGLAVQSYNLTATADIGNAVVESNEENNSALITFVVVDKIQPVLTVPAPVSVEASGTLTPVDIGAATATDFSAVTISNDAPEGFPIGTTVVTWTATDAFDNSSTGDQNVTVVDSTVPVLTVPASVSVEASGTLTPVDIGAATATDISMVIISNDAPEGFSIGTTVVAWTATDAAGNFSTAVQNVTVVDSTEPVLTVPASVSVEASGTLTPVDIGAATATDISTVTIRNNAPVEGFPIGATPVTWTATDAFNNISTAVQSVTVGDSTVPVLTVPAPVSVEASGTLTPVDIGAATATDFSTVTISNDAPEGFPIGTTVVTWTATDAFNNISTGVQNVTVVDSTVPVLTVPASVSVEASGTLTPVDIGAATATDISAVTISNNAPAEGFSIGTTPVTWTATDAFNNISTAVQSVTVGDSTVPVLTVPASVSVEASGTLTPVDIGAATATDISTVTISNNVPAEGFPIGATPVTWTATDAFNNISTAVQNVTVVDSIAPVLTAPDPITVVSTTALSTLDLGAATAEDFSEFTISNDAPAEFPIGLTLVTWTASDISGNSSAATQTVTVIMAANLVVTNLSHSPLSPANGELVTYAAFVSNQGDVTAAASTLKFLIGNVEISYQVLALAAGSSFTVNHQATVSASALQTVNIIATADSEQQVLEFNENDNSSSDSYVVKVSADLVVTSLSHAPAQPTVDEQIVFTAVVSNQGTGIAEASTLQLAIGDEVPGTDTLFQVPFLEPGQSYQVTRQAMLTANSYVSTASADINNKVFETDESNNVTTDSFSVVIPLTVDIPDLPVGVDGVDYPVQQLTATGGSGSVSWNVLSGSLPTGLTLSDSGQIGGIPVSVGSFQFTVEVVGSGQSDTLALSIEITPATAPGVFFWGDNGHYYQYIETGQQSWTDAVIAAESMTHAGRNGHLVTITSAGEQAFVNNLRITLSIANWRPWIGLNNSASAEGVFVWVTGEPVTYTNWSRNEPNDGDGNEDYVDMLRDGEWSDVSNSAIRPYGFIVEY
jgi:hypothetical protein